MSLNDNIKKIGLVDILILIILSSIFLFSLNTVDFNLNLDFVFFILILFFIFKLRDSKKEFIADFKNIFKADLLKLILYIVVLNIIFSYGMLYLTDYLLKFSTFKSLISFSFVPKASLILLGGYFSKLIIAPISEELLFRGIFFNKFKLIVPTSYAILASSLLFGSFHSVGSILSAIIFAVCMCLLYLKTDNILVIIFAHFLNNFFAEIIFALDSDKMMFTNSLVVTSVSLLAVVSFVLIIAFIFREWNNIK